MTRLLTGENMHIQINKIQQITRTLRHLSIEIPFRTEKEFTPKIYICARWLLSFLRRDPADATISASGVSSCPSGIPSHGNVHSPRVSTWGLKVYCKAQDQMFWNNGQKLWYDAGSIPPGRTANIRLKFENLNKAKLCDSLIYKSCQAGINIWKDSIEWLSPYWLSN